MQRRTCLALCLFIAACSQQPKQNIGLSPKEALQSFELPDGFKIELIAAEPLVADPVAMEIDESGNLFVLEMHGYPEDLKGSGVVKLLSDTDADGIPDKSVVFADSLVLPTGIMKWKKGILVVDVPHVWYLEDSNQDGKADIKKEILTGFALTNPQHIANTPIYGIDNWIYIAHQGVVTPKVSMIFNDTGSAVRFPGNSNALILPRDADGRNIRFRPDTYELEMLSGESQYGHSFDPWGHHIGTSNANHLFHEVIGASYLRRNPDLLVAEAIQNIPDHGDAAEVFPITINPEHQLLTDVGVITSSCGVTWYQGSLFPDSFSNVTFIAEPVHNLVHADRIQPKGASFTASRVYQKKEFLASRDSWFRPVQFYVGPDGALYVIDYYRQIIEHPEWMSEEVNKSGALYNGSDKGRIYRITPTNAGSPEWLGKLQLGEASTEKLVQTLANKTIWWRRTAQRLLMDRLDVTTPQLLRKFIDSSLFAPGIVQALWLLESQHALDEVTLIKLLRHPVAGVRENAVKVAESFLKDNKNISDMLISLKDDPDARVRFQVLCSLGAINNMDAEKARAEILVKDIEDNWVQIAMLTAVSGKEMTALKNAINLFGNKVTTGAKGFIENAAALISLTQNESSIKDAIKIALHEGIHSWWSASVLKGLVKGMEVKGKPAAAFQDEIRACSDLFTAKAPEPVRKEAIYLLKLLSRSNDPLLSAVLLRAKTVAGNKMETTEYREDAVVLLELDSSVSVEPILKNLLQPTEPETLQKKVLATYTQFNETKAGVHIIKIWKQLSPGLRETALSTFFRSSATETLLLEAMEKGAILPSSIGWQKTVWLMNEDNEVIRSRARKLLAGSLDSRDVVLKKFEPALTIKGVAAEGLKIFQRNCSVCHQVGGLEGKSFGPDLASIRNRDSKFIMADILNPNRTIADKYEMWSISKRNGEKISGIMASETSASITLKNLAGEAITLQRMDIATMEASDVSAMPQGLEASITVNEMAHLLAFLKEGLAEKK